MLDNIFIRFRDWHIVQHLSEEFFEYYSNLFVKEFRLLHTYRLYNDLDGINRHYLSICINYDAFTVTINGSIRKWYYGAASLEGLTKNDLYNILKLLSECLQIPVEILAEFEFSRLEFGLNIPVKIKEEFFINKANRYKNSSFKPKTDDNYIRFRSNTKEEEIKLYGKIQEIIADAKGKRKTIEDLDYLDRLIQKKKILRIELKYRGGKARIYKKIGVKTIGDFYNSYIDMLNLYWVNINKLEFNNNEDDELYYNPKKNSSKELYDFALSIGLKTIGVKEFNRMINTLPSQQRRSARFSYKQKLLKMSSADRINVKLEMMKSVKREVIMTMYRNNILKHARRVFTINNTI